MPHTTIMPILRLGKSLSVVLIIILLWIVLTKLDIVAHATGQIAPDGKIKTINVLHSSIVQNLLVKEGDEVHAGQLLAQLDSQSQVVQQEGSSKQLYLDKLSLRRIDALLGNTSMVKMAEDKDNLYEQAKAQMTSQMNTHEANMAQALATLAQANSEHTGNVLELEKLQSSVSMWEKQIDSYENLKSQGFISDMAALEKINQAKEKIKEVEVQKKRVQTSQAKLNQVQQNIEKTRHEFKAQLLQEKNDLLSKINDIETQLRQATHQVKLTDIISPVDGIVKELSITTQGAVLNEGAILLTIVPKNDKLQANIWLANEDVGHVKVGDKVKIKIQSYPFQKYGLINGEVKYIGADAKEETQASDHANKSYVAHVELEKDFVGSQEQPFNIKSGMQVQADIKIGERTIFEYLISPMQKVVDEAAGER